MNLAQIADALYLSRYLAHAKDSAMWSEAKLRQLDELRQREEHGSLTHAEAQRLGDLLHEIDQEEQVALLPTIERMREERSQLESALADAGHRNAELAAIASRYADLLNQARNQLSELIAGHEALRADLERVVRS